MRIGDEQREKYEGLLHGQGVPYGGGDCGGSAINMLTQ